VAVSGRGFEQKAYSLYILVIDILAAIAIGWLWQGKKWTTKIVTVGIVIILTISGIVNLFPIKNEFAFPLVGKDMLGVSEWIRKETPKDAIFVSYADIIDPVALSGRKNYLGFFGNIGGSMNRVSVVKSIYEGDVNQARAWHISYILVPKWEKSGFPYAVKIEALKAIYSLVYEDEWYIVFAVR
jgi:hypothetical protein